jgi:hypothetical protein
VNFVVVKKVKSEMYAYNMINCLTNNSNEYISQFWNFYRGPGLLSSMKDKDHGIQNDVIRSSGPSSPSTNDYLRFKDLHLACPNLTSEFTHRPVNNKLFNQDLVISSPTPAQHPDVIFCMFHSLSNTIKKLGLD